MTKKQTNPVDDKPIDFNKLKPEELMKYEIAKELGLFDKVMETGWKSLSAKETGRIGGLITKKKRELKEKESQNTTC
ncbi:MAG: small, acid-soluble spore protein, alpha/beta type [bacterium]|nr:small, acid-soluble spore protein, alpha/beta type [bacterium]